MSVNLRCGETKRPIYHSILIATAILTCNVSICALFSPRVDPHVNATVAYSSDLQLVLQHIRP